MSCENKLANNFLRQCGYKPAAGLDPNVFLINTEDIDKASSQLSESGMLISTMVLADSAKAFKAEGAGKYPQGTTSMAQGDNGPDWTHGLTLRILYYGEDERAAIQDAADGGRLTAIVKKKDTGLSGELTYEVLGWKSGMEVSTIEWSSSENGGVATITLATVEGEEEVTDRKIFLDTDVDTTTSWIDTNLYTEAAA